MRNAAFESQPQSVPDEYLISTKAKNSKSAGQPGKVVRGKFAAKKIHDDEPDGSPGTKRALRQSQQELRQLSVQLLTIQEKERQRIAADLHDGIGQSLSLIKLSMESVTQLIVSGKHQEAVASLQWMTHKVQDAIAELRRTTTDLRPSTLDDLGILPTMTWFFREFESVCCGKIIERNLNISESDVPMPLKPTIFRIVQEAMNNIVKHANAGRIRVDLVKSGNVLHLSIEDDGKGFDPAGLSVRKGCGRGFGLLTMKERARSSNGSFEITSMPGAGTHIRISWRLKGHAVKQGVVETSQAGGR